MCHSKKPAQQKREKKTTSLSSLPQDNSMGIRVLLGGDSKNKPKIIYYGYWICDGMNDDHPPKICSCANPQGL